MRFGRHLMQEEADAIPLAPLIDIVFLTLVFFLTISTYSTIESEVDIALPTADSAVQNDRSQGEIYINIRKDGAIVLNGREMNLEELQDVLMRVAELFPGGAVIVRGDREANLGKAIAVLDCCRKADIWNVSFAALREETQGAK
ncbi:MAG TPA: biopolymer transporter ExbD [Candidatus Hydrogenedentes bacterium]|nr:biopolymer transporter ExbD [Candidatus Hydrogenedentota bacterium]HOT52035.1 biopolymer transporter ExbD [Candidatus Hydrogenedentota bacterium]HOV75557.1 biopolymer transporter ExbD [Candidatus Hydrogenedentota bacterium]HPC17749.1 biopolymer transporter ExbD [Candidatus Hydrogenedentota bacterium]HRT20137.1 biopolymer transporter ExbD [Candidatus Hydrogenedentota bacterium]